MITSQEILEFVVKLPFNRGRIEDIGKDLTLDLWPSAAYIIISFASSIYCIFMQIFAVNRIFYMQNCLLTLAKVSWQF